MRMCVRQSLILTQWLDPIESKSQRHLFWSLVRVFCEYIPLCLEGEYDTDGTLEPRNT